MTIDINPTPKPRMTRSDVWKTRLVVVRYRAFCDELRHQYRGNFPDDVSLEFHVPMPKSWSKKKQIQKLGQPHTQRPDLDNYIKAVFDALCEDDSHIWSVKAQKYWSNMGKIIIERSA